MLTQPSSLKAKFNNEFGVRNWVNEIPACGSKMHRQQQIAITRYIFTRSGPFSAGRLFGVYWVKSDANGGQHECN